MQSDQDIGTLRTTGKGCFESPGHEHGLSQGIIWSSDDPNSQACPEGGSWIRLGIRREIPRTMGHFGHQAGRNQAGQKILHEIDGRQRDRGRRRCGVGQLLHVRAARAFFQALAGLAAFCFSRIRVRRGSPARQNDPVFVKTNAERRSRCRNQQGHAKQQQCGGQATNHAEHITSVFREARNFCAPSISRADELGKTLTCAGDKSVGRCCSPNDLLCKRPAPCYGFRHANSQTTCKFPYLTFIR